MITLTHIKQLEREFPRVHSEDEKNLSLRTLSYYFISPPFFDKSALGFKHLPKTEWYSDNYVIPVLGPPSSWYTRLGLNITEADDKRH